MIKPLILFLSVGLLSFIVYMGTLAPTITWRNDGVDSGDLATAVAVAGVPHPPGYPTYLILGDLFKLLPIGDVAYRLNLLSATCAALTVAVMGLVIYQTLALATRSWVHLEEEASQTERLIWVGAASASLTLAFSSTFWSQAVIAEVYTLNALFGAVLLYGVLQVQPANEKWLAPGLAGLLGLSLGNHPSILLLFPLLLVRISKARWHWRRIVAIFLAFCAGMSVYLIIPIRAAAQPPVNWGLATTWPNFLWLVSAEPYRQFLFALPWKFIPARLLAELHLLGQAFLWWGLPVAFIGLQNLIQLNRPLAYGSLVTFLFVSAYAVGYNTTDSYVYLLPVLLIFSLWLGWGLHELSAALSKFMRTKLSGGYLLGWILLLLPALSLWWNFSTQNISQDHDAYAYAQHSLQLVAPGAVIITENDPQTFALWYGRYGLSWRTDVAIVNSNLLPYTWYRQSLRQTHAHLRLSDQTGRPITTLQAFIEQNLANSPVYLATIQSPPLISYRLESLDHLQRVVKVMDE